MTECEPVVHRAFSNANGSASCVMDQGNVVELDTPEVLFAKTSSIFRGMCDRSSITIEDIRAAMRTRPLVV